MGICRQYPFEINHKATWTTPIKQIEAIELMIGAIMQLGEEEHTSDWDPYIRITNCDDLILDTATGYPEFKIDEANETIIVTLENEDDSTFSKSIAISDIKSIQLLEP